MVLTSFCCSVAPAGSVPGSVPLSMFTTWPAAAKDICNPAALVAEVPTF